MHWSQSTLPRLRSLQWRMPHLFWGILPWKWKVLPQSANRSVLRSKGSIGMCQVCRWIFCWPKQSMDLPKGQSVLWYVQFAVWELFDMQERIHFGFGSMSQSGRWSQLYSVFIWQKILPKMFIILLRKHNDTEMPENQLKLQNIQPSHWIMLYMQIKLQTDKRHVLKIHLNLIVRQRLLLQNTNKKRLHWMLQRLLS